jgi:ubiquinone/menaquinone biosynthesis C-methylase UbiE
MVGSDSKLPWFDNEENRSIFLKLLAPAQGERILDVGAGKGEVAALVASKGSETYAIEPDSKRVDRIRHRYPSVNCALASSEKVPRPDGYFDKVYSTLAWHHFEDKSQSARELARVVKPGGLLLIVEIQPRSGLGRILRFLENGLLRANIQLETMDALAGRMTEAGRLELKDSAMTASLYFVAFTRKSP